MGKKSAKYLASPMIKVVVGDDEPNVDRPNSFFVHKDLITSRSHFFAKALRNYAGSSRNEKNSMGTYNGDTDRGSITWIEGEEGVVRLPEDEAEVFANYLQLLYYEVVPAVASIEEAATNPPSDKAEAQQQLYITVGNVMGQWYDTVIDLYVLCEKLQDTASEEVLFRAIIKAASKIRLDSRTYFPGVQQITTIYAGTPASDPIRSWLVDCWVLMGQAPWAPRCATDLPLDFMHDVMVGMFQERVVPEGMAACVRDVERYVK